MGRRGEDMEFIEVEKWYDVKFPGDELERQNSRGGIGKSFQWLLR